MKQKIIAIMGPSGAGKDTVANILSIALNIPLLCSFTTRPMRDGEVNGREHFFVKECKTPKEDMLAYTVYGGYEYWTEISQIEDTAIYVIDEKGIMDICERFPDIELVNIYVAAKPETLKARGIAPERMKRDEYRVTMDINCFDYVITNNSSLYDLMQSVITTALQITNYILSHLSNNHPEKYINISNMTLNEAIEHCKKVAKEQENCNKDCSLEHRQLAIWLSDLKAITENSYEEFKCETNKYAHDYTLIALQGRLAANPSISPKEVAKLVADDVKYLLEELALNNRYFGPKKV